MKDLRLYYYESGVLHKASVHKFKEEAKVDGVIAYWHGKNLFTVRQFVLVEYFDKYKSRIVKLYEPKK